MSTLSKIEWTDATWNPTTGCTKVSPGCDHCYAEKITERWHGPGSFAEVKLHPDRLDMPLRWRKPRRVFVNSMSDLFHDKVPDEFIARVFATMALAHQHIYQVLTKRHGRMRSLLSSDAFRESVALKVNYYDELYRRELANWPLPNVWLGCSVEDQKRADLRIPALLETTAAVRFLSCEPLLGMVDLSPWTVADSTGKAPCIPGLHWVIVGGESGPSARPMAPYRARLLRDQCRAAGVAFFFKQWGEWAPYRGKPVAKDWRTAAVHPAGMTALTPDNPFDPFEHDHPYWTAMERVGRANAGRELDGRTWDQYPQPLSVGAL